jgi:hypothetical protein
MKKKVRKLAKKAGFILWADEPWNPGDVIDWAARYDKELDKFAKLIAARCIKNMETCEGDLDFAIWKTKKDFGLDS